MNCLTCGHNNPGTVPYCQQCGGKLDPTADEIREALVQKAQDERAQNTEFYARQSLFFAVIVFLAALTLFVLSGGAPEDSYAVPSVVSQTGYTEIEYPIRDRLTILKGLVPFEEKRK